MIHLDDVWKSFDGRPALRGVTLHVGQGDAVVLCGPSGAGKTTLLRLIYLAETPDQGTLTIAGRDLGKLRRSSIPYVRRNIGVVFQDFKLMADRTVLDNVAVSMEVVGASRAEALHRARAALDLVGLLPDAGRTVRTLPGGLQQRVAMARALCGNPPILLCDEPTGNLDPLRARDLLELLEGVRGRGTTLLIATHDPSAIAFGTAHGWRRAELQAGQLLTGGLSPEEDLARREAVVGLTVGPAAETETLRLQTDRTGPAARPLRVITAERSLELPIEVEIHLGLSGEADGERGAP
jgi:cell division transport system ATP-binding protein